MKPNAEMIARAEIDGRQWRRRNHPEPLHPPDDAVKAHFQMARRLSGQESGPLWEGLELYAVTFRRAAASQRVAMRKEKSVTPVSPVGCEACYFGIVSEGNKLTACTCGAAACHGKRPDEFVDAALAALRDVAEFLWNDDGDPEDDTIHVLPELRARLSFVRPGRRS
jgi:hypothetical protein